MEDKNAEKALRQRIRSGEIRRQDVTRRLAEPSEDRSAVFFMSDDDSAFPPSVCAPANQSVTVRSSFCHGNAPFRQHNTLPQVLPNSY